MQYEPTVLNAELKRSSRAVTQIPLCELARILNIQQGKDGFFCEKEPDLTSIDTAQDGIFIAGCAQGPKDIAETVAEAEATAGRILSLSK
jgi:heterodisulfide reductase subunit A-like polyferredoxin